MNARHIALVAGFTVVLGALVVLLVEVNASPELEAPEEALAQAQARYERRQSARKAKPRAPRSATPSAGARAAAAKRAAAKRAAAKRAAKQDNDTNARKPPRFYARQPAPKRTGKPRPDKDPARVAQIGKLYDYHRFDEALEMAEDYLRIDPAQSYVRRVAVTSSCALGEGDKARAHFAELSPKDQHVVRKRCARYSFKL